MSIEIGRRATRAKVVSRTLSVLVIAIGSVILLGWALGIPFLITVLPDLATMKDSTAIAFILTGVALWILNDELAGKRQRLVAQLCIVAVLLIGLIALSETMFGWNFGMDHLLFKNPVPGIPISEALEETTAYSFVLLALALWLLGNTRRIFLAQIISLAVIGAAILALISYVYGVVSLYGFLASPISAMAFLLAAIGTLMLRPQNGMMSTITTESPGGAVARRLLIAVVLIPLILGWLELKFEQQSLVDLAFGSALDIFAHIVILVALVWWTAHLLNRADIVRKHLEEDRRLLAALVESSDDAIIGKSLDGIITNWNRGAERLYGYTAGEGIGKPISLLIPADRPDDFAQIMDKIRNGQSVDRFETVRQKRDGTLIDVSLIVSPVKGSLGKVTGASIIAHDITERKRAEQAELKQRRIAEAMRDSLEALTSSLDVVTIMQLIFDYAELVVPYNSASVIEFEGDTARVTHSIGFAQEVIDYFETNEFSASSSSYFRIIQEGKPVLINDTQLASDFTVVPIINHPIRSTIGVPISLGEGVLGVLAINSETPNRYTPDDVQYLMAFARYAALALGNAYHASELEHRVAERTSELNHAKERVEAILNNSTDAIVLLASTGLRIQQANPAFATLFEAGPDDYFNRSLLDLIGSDDIDEIKALIQTTLTEHAGGRTEVRCRRKDGSLFEAQVSIGYFIAEATGTEGFVCTIQDITERKRAEESLVKAFEKERELNDLKSRFILVASHEIRTPLAVILSSSSLLEVASERMTAEQQLRHLSKIRQGVREMAQLLEDVLTYSKADAGQTQIQPEDIHLKALCQEVIAEIAATTGKAHSLSFSCADQVDLVISDKNLLRSILDNLLSNAVKYSPPGSEVSLDLSVKSAQVVCSVTDHGIGIPDRDLEHSL